MDLLNLLRLLRRNALVVTVASIAVGALLVVTYASAPPSYRTSASVVLLNPPPPSEPSGAVSPGSQNPYVRFNDITVMVDILVRVMRTNEVAHALGDRGLRGEYTIAANAAFYRGPIVDIAVEAGSPAVAKESARLVMKELDTQLERIQSQQGTDPSYFIRATPVVTPERASTVLSSALRRLIAVGFLGLIAIIGAAMIADALPSGRRRRDKEALTDAAAPDLAPALTVLPTRAEDHDGSATPERQRPSPKTDSRPEVAALTKVDADQRPATEREQAPRPRPMRSGPGPDLPEENPQDALRGVPVPDRPRQARDRPTVVLGQDSARREPDRRAAHPNARPPGLTNPGD